jgi:Mitochondrial carrier protein
MLLESLLAGFVQVGIGHPMDTIKVRMQSTGWSAPKVIQYVYRTRGIKGFYAGSVTPFIMAPIYNGVTFSSYQAFIQEKWTPFGAGAMIGGMMGFVIQPFEVIKCRIQNGNYPIFTNIGAGLKWTVGKELMATGVYFGVFEKLQEQNPHLLPLNGGIAGCLSLLSTHPLDTMKTTYQVGGTNKNMYKGLHIALLRSMIVNSFIFSIYK